MNILEQLIDTTNEILRLVNMRMRETAKLCGSTLLQVQVLLLLNDHPGATNTELANVFGVSFSAITQLIDRLTTGQFIRRESDPEDRRISRLYLTDRGVEEINSFITERREQMRKLFNILPADDLKALLRIHTLLLHGLNKTQNESQ